jgi:hypothetical protein
MKKISKEVEAIMLERFGKDSIIALATAHENIPYVRSVDAFYEHGAFYVLTHGLSGKMKQVFSAWIDNGHNNFDDKNTCILCIKLTSGILFSNGTRYEVDFTE